MSATIDERVRAIVRHAYDNAPAIRGHFDAADLTPADVAGVADLDKIPVMPKDDLIARQQTAPPFGGMLAVPLSEVGHIFFSPGPLYEPDAGDDPASAATVVQALRDIGFTPDDIVLNSLSYHLVPAGLLLDRALRQLGCTVVPGGVGNSELQVQMMRDLGVTGYAGTPSFLMRLIETAEEQGADFKENFQLSKALVSAEPLPPPLRQKMVETYGITVGNAYATAELGVLALNVEGGMAMRLMPEPVIQVVDPQTGASVGPGEAGEVVVTTFNRVYPLIRFGTGDMALNIDPAPGESAQGDRSITLVGRSGEAVKVRGMFVHPNQLRYAVGQVTRATAVQGVVSRPQGDRDHLTVRVALNRDIVASNALIEQLGQAIRQACRVRADEIQFLAENGIAQDAPGMVDERSWS